MGEFCLCNGVDESSPSVDFGLAMDLAKGGSLHMVGSPFWMSPEIINRQPHTLAVCTGARFTVTL